MFRGIRGIRDPVPRTAVRGTRYNTADRDTELQ